MTDVLALHLDPGTVEALQLSLGESFDVKGVCTRGMSVEDMAGLISQEHPRVVVFEVGDPRVNREYERWQQLASLPSADVPYVLLSTNPHHFPGHPPRCRARIVLSHPVDLETLEHAVQFFIDHPCTLR